MIGAGLRIALRTEVPFERLLATGLTVLIGVQSFIIIAGVIRVLPLTGVTLPFVSYGGSSLIANYVLLALLLRISDDTATRGRRPRVRMTRQIRALGIGLMVCFVVLFVQLNRLTVFQAAELNDNPNNTRDILRDFSQPRGSITTADGVVIARSVPSGDRFEFQREYPEGPLFAHVTGFYSFTLGSSGVEKTYNDELAGRTLRAVVPGARRPVRRQGPRRRPHPHGARRPAARRHRAARASARARWWPSTRGPARSSRWCRSRPTTRTCWPTTTRRRPTDAMRLLDASPEKPRLARSYQERFFPGSTFKVVTGTAGILRGGVTADEPVYPVTNSYTPPGTDPTDPQLRRHRRAAARCSRSCGCRATPRSPRWAWTPAPSR